MLPPRERSLARAATRPLNLAVLGILVAIALVAAPWVAVLALPIYGVLVAASYRPPPTLGEPPAARRDALSGVEAALRPRVEHALRDQAAVVRQLGTLPVQPAGLAEQVSQLGRDIVAAARRASEVDAYLRGVDGEALRARLAAQRERAAESPAAGLA